jgi:hypothetical protein
MSGKLQPGGKPEAATRSPSAYSFWASMMSSVESWTEAVESGIPAICLNEAAMLDIDCGEALGSLDQAAG